MREKATIFLERNADNLFLAKDQNSSVFTSIQISLSLPFRSSMQVVALEREYVTDLVKLPTNLDESDTPHSMQVLTRPLHPCILPICTKGVLF
ncbi:hypothetical protein HanRHA438_Chr00c05g0845421 [Helianthus annuus]|nr:hypothetical protein HanRHA438_Chr00c05g0845421 [Helianthus annuus]